MDGKIRRHCIHQFFFSCQLMSGWLWIDLHFAGCTAIAYRMPSTPMWPAHQSIDMMCQEHIHNRFIMFSHGKNKIWNWELCPVGGKNDKLAIIGHAWKLMCYVSGFAHNILLYFSTGPYILTHHSFLPNNGPHIAFLFFCLLLKKLCHLSKSQKGISSVQWYQFSWEQGGHCCQRLCTAIVPFWFSMEHH